jgi:hypothetical protein
MLDKLKGLFYVVIREGDSVPWWMGAAYNKGWKRQIICMAIPLNFIIGCLRRVYIYLSFYAPGTRTKFDGLMHEQIKEAYNKGYQLGKRDGFDAGAKAAGERVYDYLTKAVTP